jgi:hypothetical protein
MVDGTEWGGYRAAIATVVCLHSVRVVTMLNDVCKQSSLEAYEMGVRAGVPLVRAAKNMANASSVTAQSVWCLANAGDQVAGRSSCDASSRS